MTPLASDSLIALRKTRESIPCSCSVMTHRIYLRGDTSATNSKSHLALAFLPINMQLLNSIHKHPANTLTNCKNFLAVVARLTKTRSAIIIYSLSFVVP
jgi:hypothetical protein